MCKNGEEESAGRMERVGKNRRGDLCQTGTSKSERKGLQDDSESSYMLYGLETVALRKRQEVELKMLRFALVVTKLDRIGHEYM